MITVSKGSRTSDSMGRNRWTASACGDPAEDGHHADQVILSPQAQSPLSGMGHGRYDNPKTTMTTHQPGLWGTNTHQEASQSGQVNMTTDGDSANFYATANDSAGHSFGVGVTVSQVSQPAGGWNHQLTLNGQTYEASELRADDEVAYLYRIPGDESPTGMVTFSHAGGHRQVTFQPDAHVASTQDAAVKADIYQVQY